MIFDRLNIFNNQEINHFCDTLYKYIGLENLLICGGVSRCLSGENHIPKDLDIVTINQEVFQSIEEKVEEWFPELKITKSQKRIIIYTHSIAVEIWNGKEIYGQGRYLYKGILPYVISNRMKKLKK